MPNYWDVGLGISMTDVFRATQQARLQRTASAAVAQGATSEQAQAAAIAAEQQRIATRRPGVTTVKSRIIGGVQTVPQRTGSVFGRRAKAVMKRQPTVSTVETGGPPGREPEWVTRCPPGQQLVNAGSRSARCIAAIRQVEAMPSTPPPGALQQPGETYAGALIRTGIERVFGPQLMQRAQPEAPPGTTPSYQQQAQAAGIIAPDAAEKILPIAAAAVGLWLVFKVL